MEAAHNGQQPGHGAVQRDLIVIGASAGGVDALQRVVEGLPAELPAAILIVLHVPSTGTSVLPQILSRHGRLPAVFARDGDELERGQIYVARADHHLLVHGSTIRLTKGPRENGHRPAIDPLFRSAARAAGPRCVGVILSGLLDDGASGLRVIASHGGTPVVQDPADAQFPSMPRAALALTRVEHIVSAADMGATLCELIDEVIDRAPRATSAPVPADRDIAGVDRVEIDDPSMTANLVEGPPTALTCPECGGALWEQTEGDTSRFVCHVGHAYSLASLLEEQGRDLETTLWSAVRSLEERADVHRRLGRRARGARAETYDERARQAEHHASELRAVLAAAGRLAAPVPEDA